MKRNLFLFLLCFFVMTGVTQAQNWFSYVGDYSSPRMIGIGMPFSWGYMLPASLMSEYQGCSITEFGFLDEGEAQFATSYTINIYLGGDNAFFAILSTSGSSFVHGSLKTQDI